MSEKFNREFPDNNNEISTQNQNEEAAHILTEAEKKELWEKIYSYRGRLIKQVAPIMKNFPNYTELVVDDVITMAYKAIDTFHGEAALKTWVTRIAINKALQFIRDNKLGGVKAPFSLEPKENTREILDRSEAGNPEQLLLQSEKHKYLATIVASLKPAYRDVWKLRYEQELPAEEIANKLNLTLANVKNRLFRANVIIQEKMKKIYR